MIILSGSNRAEYPHITSDDFELLVSGCILLTSYGEVELKKFLVFLTTCTIGDSVQVHLDRAQRFHRLRNYRQVNHPEDIGENLEVNIFVSAVTFLGFAVRCRENGVRLVVCSNDRARSD